MDNPSAEPTDHQTTDPTPAASTSIDDQAIEWPVRRFEPSGKVVSLNDVVVREKRIELMVNDTPLLAMLALPLDVEALVLGFLFSEGLWRSREHLPRIRYDADAGRAYCEGAFDEDAVESIHRRWTFGTGCGGGGTARDESLLSDCRPLNSPYSVRAEELFAMGHTFGRSGKLYRQTGGVHACGIADAHELLLFAEDVGRHNAFDKVVGMALQQGLELTHKFALTTGRLSAEIVAKAIAHGVPILASSSAPTAMGVQWSRRFGLTLVGFLRGRRMNVYTGYQRIVPQDG